MAVTHLLRLAEGWSGLGDGGGPAGGATPLAGHVPGSIRGSDKCVALGVQVVVGVTEAGKALGREIGLSGQEMSLTSAPSYPTPGFKIGP